MSHVVTLETKVQDRDALEAARARLNLPALQDGVFDLYSGKVTGTAVQLPDWRYPAVANFETGDMKYDNFGGSWGRQEEMDKLMQAYTVEKASAEARRKGYMVEEQSIEDDGVRLVMTGYE